MEGKEWRTSIDGEVDDVDSEYGKSNRPSVVLREMCMSNSPSSGVRKMRRTAALS